MADCVSVLIGSMLLFSPQNYSSLLSMVRQSLLILFGGGMSLNGIQSCGDYIFSGHTVVLTVLNYFIITC
jgi:hypothetical protein